MNNNNNKKNYNPESIIPLISCLIANYNIPLAEKSGSSSPEVSVTSTVSTQVSPSSRKSSSVLISEFNLYIIFIQDVSFICELRQWLAGQ